MFAVVTGSGCAERRPSRRLDFARASSCWGFAAAWKDGFPFYRLGGRRDGSVGRVVGDVELREEWEMGDGGCLGRKIMIFKPNDSLKPFRIR